MQTAKSDERDRRLTQRRKTAEARQMVNDLHAQMNLAPKYHTLNSEATTDVAESQGDGMDVDYDQHIDEAVAQKGEDTFDYQ